MSDSETTKWQTCRLCGVEWMTKGFVWPDGSICFATICNSCADLWEAKMHPKQIAIREIAKQKAKKITKNPFE